MVDIETVKSFWDKRPCNIKHSNKPVGSLEYFEEVAHRRYYVEPHIRAFANFDSWKDKKVLEVGCGIGTDTVQFAKAGAHVTAIDLSEKSLDIAKEHAIAFNVAHMINFYQGNAEELIDIIPAQSFDLIYSFGVIHHTPNPRKAIINIRAFMNRMSQFRLMLYAKNSWKSIMIEKGLDQPEAQFGCPIANTYTEEGVKELLSGMYVEGIKQWHIFPFNIEKYKNYEYELEPWFKEMPTKMFDALQKKLGWHLLISACLN